MQAYSVLFWTSLPPHARPPVLFNGQRVTNITRLEGQRRYTVETETRSYEAGEMAVLMDAYDAHRAKSQAVQKSQVPA